MTAKIVRTKSKALGGITEHEKALMDEHAKLWIARAMRTDPIEPDKIIPAIEGLYAAAGLKKPRVVIVPSPLVMAFAYGASAAIWYARKNATRIATYNATDIATDIATYNATRNATYNATRIATRIATDIATDIATYNATGIATGNATGNATDSATGNATRNATVNATGNATDSATDSATRNATDSATVNATGNAESGAAAACRELAGQFGLDCALRWYSNYQGGNMWSGYDCYLTACRDILGLELREHAAYAHWEQAAIHGGFRVMHEEFCIVSDFPEIILKDEENRPHCETGPSHRWRDGWSLYHWHGVRVPAHWIEGRENLDPAEVLKSENVEQRAAGAAIIGWPKMVSKLKRKVIDGDPDTDMGALIELTLPGLREPGRFLQAICVRNGTIVEGIPRVSDIDGKPIETALAAQAWRVGLTQTEYRHPVHRT